MNLPYISAPAEIPNEEYHNGERFKDFASSSNLKNILTSPLWMKYCMDHPEDDDPTKEWKLEGGCYHDMLSSITNTGGMDEFEANTAVFDPPINKTTGEPYGYSTNAFKSVFEGFQANNPGKAIYSKTEYDNSLAMIEALRKGNKHLSPTVNNLLKIGKAEISIFCEHKANDFIQYDSGLLKVRKDLTTYNKIIDWKTVGRTMGKEAPLKPEQFTRVIADKLYGFSAAMYQYVEWMVTGRWKSFYWIAQDKIAPFDFNLISADGWAFEVQNGQMIGIGIHAEMFIRALEQYLYCLENNDFPGVSIFTKPDYKGHRIAQTKVPGYEINKSYEFFN